MLAYVAQQIETSRIRDLSWTTASLLVRNWFVGQCECRLLLCARCINDRSDAIMLTLSSRRCGCRWKTRRSSVRQWASAGAAMSGKLYTYGTAQHWRLIVTSSSPSSSAAAATTRTTTTLEQWLQTCPAIRQHYCTTTSGLPYLWSATRQHDFRSVVSGDRVRAVRDRSVVTLESSHQAAAAACGLSLSLLAGVQLT